MYFNGSLKKKKEEKKMKHNGNHLETIQKEKVIDRGKVVKLPNCSIGNVLLGEGLKHNFLSCIQGLEFLI